MNVILAVVAFLLVLGPLILIHEFGHFIALRLTGVTVLEFGLGFPPRAKKVFEQGGTDFTLNWLPIGGFVRPLGEDFVKPLAEGETDVERVAFEARQAEREAQGKKRIKPKSVVEATPLQRIFYLAAGAAMNFLGAFVVLFITALIGQPAVQPQVLAVMAPAGASAAQLQKGDLIAAVNGNKVGNSTQLNAVLSNAKSADLTVTRGKDTLKVTVNAGDPINGLFISQVEKESPADAALKPGDFILSVDGQTFTTFGDFQSYIAAHAGQNVTIAYQRDAEKLTASLIPRTNPPAGSGRLGVGILQGYNPAYGIGFMDYEGAVQKYSIGEAIPLAASETGETLTKTVQAPIDIITGKLKGDAGRIVSPVGIAQMSSEVLQTSVQDQTPYLILSFIATISIALGVTNLLPIPGLDGGRILFVLVEIIRGKPLAPEREGMVHLVGLMLLLGLMAVLVVNDVLHPLGPILGR